MNAFEVNVLNIMELMPVYSIKLKNLLEKFLNPEFQLKNDSNLDRLLSYLSGKDNTDLGENLLNLPILEEWIQNAVDYWKISNTNIPQSVASFAVNLMALLVKTESRFLTLCAKNSVLKLCQLLNLRSPFVSPSIKCGYIKLLTSLTSHKSGLDYLILTQFWEDGIGYSLSGETVYIQREALNFIYRLLLKSTELHESFSFIVVEKIMNRLNDEASVITNNSPQLNCQLVLILRLINFVLKTFLKEQAFASRDYKLANIFLNNYQLEQIIANLLGYVKDADLLFELTKVLVVIYYYNLLMENQTEIMPIIEVRKLHDNLLKLLLIHVTHKNIDNFLKLVQESWFCLYIINSRLPSREEMERACTCITNILMVCQAIAVCQISFDFCKVSVLELETDDIKHDFFFKASAAMSENCTRALYKIRDAFFSENGMLFSYAYKSIMSVEISLKNMIKEDAILYFQILCYGFKDINDVIKNHPSVIHTFSNEDRFLCILMRLISKIVTSFSLTWKDCIETICILDLCIDFLNVNWPPKVVLEALKLLNIVIEKRMTPSMILLADSPNETSITQVPSILYAKLHDPNWEVRDSSLEVLRTIAIIAQTKFPSYQSIIIDSNLPQLLPTICGTDTESFIRATALKCLQELIKIPRIWAEILEKEDLPGKIMIILEEETEAIVRCEAATLMCNIYKHQLVYSSIIQKINETMYHAAISDLHWEVKVNALEFWKIVINKQLTNQGMIDGTFPNVTFSKENRKIVTLTEKEIQIRLSKVLHKLSECGCLSVLLIAMQEDCDIAVNKKAVEVTKSLSSILQMYNINASSICEVPVSPVGDCPNNNKTINFSVPMCLGSAVESDTVIDQIVNSKDVNLLKDIFICDTDISPSYTVRKKIEVVSPSDFLNFLQTDLDLLIAEKQRWLNKVNDLGSLLDDMLKSYDEFDDLNVMDCY